MDLDFVSVHKNAKRELDQYPAILTSRLVNNIYVELGQGLLKLSASHNEMKVEYFFGAILRISYFIEGGEGLCVTRNKGKKYLTEEKKKLKEIRDS